MPHRYIQQPCGFERQLPLSNVKNAGLQYEVWHFSIFMDTTPLHCLLADPSFAAYYDHASLNAADSQRFGCHAATGAASRLASQPRIKTANRFTDCITEPQQRLCRFIVCASSLNSRCRYRIYPTARFQSAVGFSLHAGRTRLFGNGKLAV